MLKQCPPDKILNPKTNRCVNRDGLIGKTLEGLIGKVCKDEEILNPKTKRCVKKAGAIGKKLLRQNLNNDNANKDDNNDKEKLMEDVTKKVLERQVPIFFPAESAFATNMFKEKNKNITPSLSLFIPNPSNKHKQDPAKFTNSPLERGVSRFAIAESINVVEKSSKRYLFFHGTRMKHLLNMINKGVQPIGDGRLGKGFYVSADPNVPSFYAAHGSAANLGDEVIIQFSMSPTKAIKLIGTSRIFPPDGKGSTVELSTSEGYEFYKAGNGFPIETYYNFFTPGAINRLRLDAIYINYNPTTSLSTKKAMIEQIRNAQRSAEYKRLNSSNSNSNSTN